MTIQEEIAQLKIQLQQNTDETEEAKLLLLLLNKYELISSSEGAQWIPRLRELAEKLNNDEYSVWALFYLGIENRLSNKPAEALENFTKALNRFQLLQAPFGIRKATSNIGLTHFAASNYSAALENFTTLLKIYEDNGDGIGASRTLGNIGAVQEARGNYSEALTNYLQAVKIMRQLGDEIGEATFHHSLGNVHMYQGNFEEALKSYRASLAFREKLGEKNAVASTLNNVGHVYQQQGKYSEALKNYSRAQALSKETGNPEGIAFAIGSMGILNLAKEDYPLALKNFTEALEIFKAIEDRMNIAMTYVNLGKAYTGLKEQEPAVKYFKLGIELGESLGAKYVVKTAYTALYDSYKSFGHYKEALEYFIKFYEIEKVMLGEDTLKQITNLNFLHNTEQKEKDLEIEQLRNVELKKEKDRSETLLLNILPEEVAEELKLKGTAAAKHFDDVTVLFTDFKGFTTLSERLTPQQLVDELHACFSTFDEIISKHNIEKIKTVGDAYLAAAGLPLPIKNHAENILNAAIEIRQFMLDRKNNLCDKTFELRIGIHSGSVVAGIVGVKKFAYDIWGDTVNTAARMEQNSEPGKINISETTYQLVKDKFNCEYRGEIEAKNKGKMKMYYVS